MNYLHLVTEIKAEYLQSELNSLANEGWRLIQVVPLNKYQSPGLDGAVKVLITYQCFFKKLQYDNRDTSKKQE
jgi:hypothetical protein